MTTELTATGPMLHLHFNFGDGTRTEDVPLSALDIGNMSTDAEIKTATAVYFNVPVEKFRNYVVDPPAPRAAGDNLTLRPEAVFGS